MSYIQVILQANKNPMYQWVRTCIGIPMRIFRCPLSGKYKLLFEELLCHILSLLVNIEQTDNSKWKQDCGERIHACEL